MIRVKDILGWLDSLAPFRFAEAWDNCGLQAGNPEAAVTRILVALDPSTPVLTEARDLECQCLVTHHPLLLQPLRSIRTDSWPGSVVARALLSGISIIAAHTNLDAARSGTNAQLARLLALEAAEPLEAEPAHLEDARYRGMGLAGFLPEETTALLLAERLNEVLGGVAIRIAGDWRKKVRRVAVCAGSGGSLIGQALGSGADLLVTGDLKYHDARFAEESGIVVVDIGHFASEKPVLGPLADFLRSKVPSEAGGFEVFVSKSETDPFRSAGFRGCNEKKSGS